MVRVYFQIPNAIAIEYKKQPCPNVLLQIVQLIMQPYSFRTSQIDWSTVYQVRYTFILRDFVFIRDTWNIVDWSESLP